MFLIVIVIGFVERIIPSIFTLFIACLKNQFIKYETFLTQTGEIQKIATTYNIYKFLLLERINLKF